jgi:hypothetical protein
MNPQKLAGQCAKLKCCLNFELENYIEALKEFPDKNIVLATKDSEYYFFKLDAFARKMTYSTAPNAPQNLVELPLERVIEIIELNEKGVKPDSLSSTDGVEKPVALDFATAVGEGSLTRFDKKKKNKKNKKHRPQK